MKIKELESIFPDPNLQTILTGGKEDANAKDVVKNLLKSPQRNSVLPLFLDSLKKQHESAYVSQIVENYKKSYPTIQAELTDDIQAKSLATFTVFQKQKATEQLVSTTTTLSAYDKFPDENHLISDFTKLAKETDRMTRLREEISNRTKRLDPTMINIPHEASKKNTKCYENIYPYDHNRSLKEKPGFYYASSDVVLPHSQNMVLSRHPMPNTVNAYFEMVIEKKAPLLITLCSPHEKPTIIPFWSNDILKTLQLPDGWTVINDEQSTAILQEGEEYALIPKDEKPKFSEEELSNKKDEKFAKWRPRIVERLLIASNGKEEHKMTHLHYENWPDDQPATSEALLKTLFRRKDEKVQNKEIPLVINCREGIGRTGVFALIDWGKKVIDAELLSGKKLDEIRLNIPEMIYQLRRERREMVTSKEQLAQIYAMLGDYYTCLKQGSSKT